MNRFGDHLMIVPAVLPLFVGAVMLALGGERSRNVNAALSMAATFALVAVGIALVRETDASPTGVAGVYRLGGWPAPFAIVLVVDRLAALMVLLTSILAAAAVVFSVARWHRVGDIFPSLVSVSADGDQWGVPHRRFVQPFRFLRGPACGFLWSGAARLGIGPSHGRAALHCFGDRTIEAEDHSLPRPFGGGSEGRRLIALTSRTSRSTS